MGLAVVFCVCWVFVLQSGCKLACALTGHTHISYETDFIMFQIFINNLFANADFVKVQTNFFERRKNKKLLYILYTYRESHLNSL